MENYANLYPAEFAEPEDVRRAIHENPLYHCFARRKLAEGR